MSYWVIKNIFCTVAWTSFNTLSALMKRFVPIRMFGWKNNFLSVLDVYKNITLRKYKRQLNLWKKYSNLKIKMKCNHRLKHEPISVKLSQNTQKWNMGGRWIHVLFQVWIYLCYSKLDGQSYAGLCMNVCVSVLLQQIGSLHTLQWTWIVLND